MTVCKIVCVKKLLNGSMTCPIDLNPTYLLSAMPQGLLPIFEIDDMTIVQSSAIAKYVAREYGMYGKTNMESTQIDQIEGTITDLRSFSRAAYRTTDEPRRSELFKKLYEEDAPKFLGYVEKLVESFGKDGYAVSNSLSLADCCIHAEVDFLHQTDKLEKLPKIAECMKRVEENENIAKWLKERPITDF